MTVRIAASAVLCGFPVLPALAESYRCELQSTTHRLRDKTPDWIEVERTDNGTAFLLTTSIMAREGERPIRAKISRETSEILALTWRDHMRWFGGISARYDFRLTIVQSNQAARLQGNIPRGSSDGLRLGARGACRVEG